MSGSTLPPAHAHLPPGVAPVALLVVGLVGARAADTLGVPLPPCPIHAATGLWCPGCGTGRALSALASGDLGLAFRQNPLFFSAMAVAVVLGVMVGISGNGRVRSTGTATGRTHVRVGWVPALLGATTVTVLFMVLRNVPSLTLLAPLPG